MYKSIIQRLKQGATMLDIGCFVGHDLRRLVFDGAPSDRLYALDIVSHWDVGYSFFRDRDRFEAHFLEADIMHPNADLSKLDGQVDIISIVHVLHPWNWDGQAKACGNMSQLSKPGTTVVGFQIGSMDPEATRELSAPAVWQSPETFRALWEEVGRATGTTWETQAELRTYAEIGWNPKDTEYLRCDADRVA